MFPVAQGITAGAGLLAEGVGDYMSYQAQTGIQNANAAIRADQQGIQTANFQQMELSTRRNQMEVVRNNQRARALATSNAANSGAQFGSGLQGAYGQEQGQAGTNLLGLNQNEAIGTNIYNLTQAEDVQQNNLAKYQSADQKGKALTSLGSSLLGSSPGMGKLFS